MRIEWEIDTGYDWLDIPDEELQKLDNDWERENYIRDYIMDEIWEHLSIYEIDLT